jgi:hypothetical protein
MREIEFSIMVSGEYISISEVSRMLFPILQGFEMRHNIYVKLLPIHWSHGWAEIVKFGLYGQGPDVSEIGAT